MVSRFEDLVAWQRARELTGEVYRVTRRAEFARDFGLSSQMQRSAVSVMANIAEGFDRNGLTEFARFLDIASGSSAELLSHVFVAFDVGYLSETERAELESRTRDVSRLVNKLRESVRTKLLSPSSASSVTRRHGARGTGH